MTWNSLELRSNSLSFWRKELDFSAQDLCVSLSDTQSYCFSKVDLDLKLALDEYPFLLEEVETLILHAEPMTITLQESPSKPAQEQTEETSPISSLEDITAYLEQLDFFLQNFQWKKVDINIPQLEISKNGTTLFAGQFFIEGESNKTLEFRSSATTPMDIQAKALFQRGESREDLIWQLDIDAHAKASPPGDWALSMEQTVSRPKEDPLLKTQGQIQFDFNRNKKEHRLISTQTITLNKNQLQANLTSFLDPPVPPMTEFKIENCSLVMQLEEKSLGQTHVDCAINTQWEWNPDYYMDKDLRVLNWKLSAEADLAGILNAGGDFHALLKLDPIQTQYVELQVRTEVSGEGSLQQNWREWTLKPDLNIQLTIPEFQAWVERFDRSQLPVPAPFNVLRGSIRASIQGDPRTLSTDTGWKIPVHAQADLQNPPQEVNLTFDAEVLVPEAFTKVTGYEVNADLLIRDFAVQLPSIDPLYGIPQVLPDPRFQEKEQILAGRPQAQPETEGLPFPVNIRVRTSQDDSVRVYYYLIEPYLGAALNLNVEPLNGSSGQVSLTDFSVNYLRRTANIERANFKLKHEPESIIEVDALARVDVDIYDLYFLVTGTVDSPNLSMWSSPELGRDDIISLLIYNRLRSDLTVGESENVAGVESAYADRALGLFGLWALASTPIQSVSYNPATQTYSASIKLSEGTSVLIGGDWERVRGLELRRRLARNWYLMSLFRPGETSEGNVFLEWQQRFGK